MLTVAAIQGKLDWSEFEHHQVASSASCAAAAQDHQARAEAKSRLRLRSELTEERLQYPHRLHALPFHFRCCRCPTFQRQILLLHRRQQTHAGRLPVRQLFIPCFPLSIDSIHNVRSILIFASVSRLRCVEGNISPSPMISARPKSSDASGSRSFFTMTTSWLPC